MPSTASADGARRVVPMAKHTAKKTGTYVTVFVKWLLIGAGIGAAGGGLGALFHHAVEQVVRLRGDHPWILWLLPVGGVCIAGMYRLARVSPGVNDVLRAIRSSEKIPLLTAPLIFVGTVITQLCGGSAGKEGAAIQLGGTVGYQTARLLRCDTKDSHIFVMCGMSAVFSAVFGTPVTAAIFALEVVSIGIFYYAAFLPCVAASLTAATVARLCGVVPTHMPQILVPAISFRSVIGIGVLAALCAAVSVLFCVSLHKGNALAARWIKQPLLRAALGGLLIVLATFALGNDDYNGAGMPLVLRAMDGQTAPYAFLLKLLFTVVTISAGFKGGEIVPSMAIGATLGCTLALWSGQDPAFFAALGLVSMFCGMLNCPMASIFLGLELFGGAGLPYYTVAAGVSYLLSGNFGLYRGQKLMYSKLRAEFINIYTK